MSSEADFAGTMPVRDDGDFRVDDLVLHPAEPRVVAVLDCAPPRLAACAWEQAQRAGAG